MSFVSSLLCNNEAIYTEKQIMIIVHAAPNTHPGGVHGALLSSPYHSDRTPFFVEMLPIASAPKFKIKKIIILLIMLFFLFPKYSDLLKLIINEPEKYSFVFHHLMTIFSLRDCISVPIILI